MSSSRSNWLRLVGFDIRLIPAFLRILDQPIVQRQLVRMLVSMLYNHNLELDHSALKRCGGISFIVRIYSETTSKECRENLFVVIYDYAIQQLHEKSLLEGDKILGSKEGVTAILKLFQAVNGPFLLASLFKVKPPSVLYNSFKQYALSDQCKFQTQPFSKTHMDSFFRVLKELNHISEELQQVCTGYHCLSDT